MATAVLKVPSMMVLRRPIWSESHPPAALPRIAPAPTPLIAQAASVKLWPRRVR